MRSETPHPDTLAVDRLEAARLLTVSPGTVDNYRKRGDIPFLRIGRRVLYIRASLVEFIARREQANAAG